MLATRAALRLWGRLFSDIWRQSRGRLLVWVLGTGLVTAGTLAQTELLKRVVDRAFAANVSTSQLALLAGAAVLFAALRGVGGYGQMISLSVAGTRAVSSLQKQVVARLIGADLAYLQARVSTGIVAQVQRDALLVQNMLGPGLGAVGRDLVTMLALVGWMFWVDWRLSLFTFLALALGALPIRQLGRRAAAHSATLNAEIIRMAARLGQLLQGIRQVKTYRMEGPEVARAWAAMDRTTHAYAGEIHVHALSTPLMELIGGIGLAALILLGGAGLSGSGPGAGTLVAFTSGFVAISLVLRRLAAAMVARRNADAALSRLFDLADTAPVIAEAADASTLPRPQGAIRFERVSFRYGEGPATLTDISFDIPAGAKVGLVGRSGAGKSTLLNLIPRFHDPVGGRILIDGQDIRGLTLSSLRQHVTLVSQESGVFDDTIHANIAYGCPGASRDAVIGAARAALLDEFITSLPDGYDTAVGEGGARLSGGQRQRLALARAILKDAPILLLDEATASLDSLTERAFQGFLDGFAQGRTTLIVAHRLLSVKDCDLILVLDQGHLAEWGTHQTLLEQDGIYAALWCSQQ
jgi:subfamily B ATP-binding cassette protein MsbA